MAEVVAPVTEHERPTGFLGLMRNRNYALLWWGQLVSELGNRFHWVAISLWVYAATHSASAVSLAVAAMFAGGLLVSLWAGVIVDRFNRKYILVVSDFTRAVLVALIPSLMRTHIGFVYLDLILISAATAFFRPALFAIVPTVVNRRALLTANSFFSAMDSGTDIFGPAIAGVLALRYGYPPLLYLDALSYVVSGFCAVAMTVSRTVEMSSSEPRTRVASESVLEGLRHVRRDKLQWGLFLLIFPAYLVGSGLNSLQTPLAKGVVGITDAQFGTLNGVWGIGFTIASLLLGWFGSRVRKSTIILGGFALAFLATGLMSQSGSLSFLLATAFAVGFANTLYYVGLTTVVMEHTPQALLGRVVSTRQVALGLVRILSPLTFGYAADVWGVRQAVLLMASAGALGTSLVVLAHPVIRNFDAKRQGIPKRLFGARSWLIGRVNSEFDAGQQRILNLVSMGVVLVAWAGLLHRTPLYAAGTLVIVCALAALGAMVHHRRWLS